MNWVRHRPPPKAFGAGKLPLNSINRSVVGIQSLNAKQLKGWIGTQQQEKRCRSTNTDHSTSKRLVNVSHNTISQVFHHHRSAVELLYPGTGANHRICRFQQGLPGQQLRSFLVAVLLLPTDSSWEGVGGFCMLRLAKPRSINRSNGSGKCWMLKAGPDMMLGDQHVADSWGRVDWIRIEFAIVIAVVIVNMNISRNRRDSPESSHGHDHRHPHGHRRHGRRRRRHCRRRHPAAVVEVCSRLSHDHRRHHYH